MGKDNFLFPKLLASWHDNSYWITYPFPTGYFYCIWFKISIQCCNVNLPFSINSLVWTVLSFSFIYFTVLVQLFSSLSFILYPVCFSMLQLCLSLDNVLCLKTTFPGHHNFLKHHWLNVIISVETLFKLWITVQEWEEMVNSDREAASISVWGLICAPLSAIPVPPFPTVAPI